MVSRSTRIGTITITAAALAANAFAIGSAQAYGGPGLAVAAPEGPACASIPADGEGSFAGMADDPAYTAASNNPELTTVAAAVSAADLVDTLNGPGPFTIFAPNNAAFANLEPDVLDALLADNELLTQRLLSHVVVGQALRSDDLIAAGRIETAGGTELSFLRDPESSLAINGGQSRIVCTNIPVANGVVHVLDTVIDPSTEVMPPTL